MYAASAHLLQLVAGEVEGEAEDEDVQQGEVEVGDVLVRVREDDVGLELGQNGAAGADLKVLHRGQLGYHAGEEPTGGACAVTHEAVIGHHVVVRAVDGVEQRDEAGAAVDPMQVLRARCLCEWVRERSREGKR